MPTTTLITRRERQSWLRATLTKPFRNPTSWWQEVVLIVAIDQLYEFTRSLAPTRIAQAFANARTVERIEGVLHLEIERGFNERLEQLPALIPPASVYYQVGHLVALLGALIWAWRRHHHRYARARNALLALTLTALAGYWFLPTAPPRFALSGVVDTVAAHPVLLVNQDSVVSRVNLYAAMPSLHVAWAVWVAITVTSLSNRPIRHLAWLHPLATTVVVLATANHYLLDAVAGTMLTVAAWVTFTAVARLSASRGRTRTRPPLPRAEPGQSLAKTPLPEQQAF